jgi:PadR family transcriptional regulator, regulatory protein PadR
MKSDQTRGQLDALILAALAHGPAHGYAVIVRLREHSDGAFSLPEGTIYPALHRLEAAGHVSSKPEQVSGRRRRIYTLTAAGEARLDEQRDEWRRFSALVTRMIGAPA